MNFGPLDNAKLWVWIGIGAVLIFLILIAWLAG
jgi:Mg2+ and Co2+ transporter CorA